MLLTELLMDGKKPGAAKFWWHSHGNLDVFWSTEDEATIQAFQSKWWISLVTNKYGEYAARLDIYSPTRVATELRFCVERDFDPVLYEQLGAEVNEKVVFQDEKDKKYSFTELSSDGKGFW